jgi:protein TonB
MPAEFFRGVVDTRRGQGPRHWSIVPMSIAAHVAIAIAIFIIPLAADEEPPSPAPLARMLNMMAARPVPPAPAAPPAKANAPRSDASAAPRSAPDTIAKELPAPPSAVGDRTTAPDGGIGSGVIGGLDPALIGPTVMPTPPPPVKRPYRTGGDIREPQKTVHVAPVYPQIAISAGVQGIVILEAVIDERGTVDKVRVLRSHPLLERAAIEAVRQWRYSPPLLNGQPVSVYLTITVNFTLHR